MFSRVIKYYYDVIYFANKMLLKLIVVTSNHLIRYKNRITHCDEVNSISEFIAQVKLDDGNILDANEVIELYAGASMTNLENVDVASISLITLKELKDSLLCGNYLILLFFQSIDVFYFNIYPTHLSKPKQVSSSFSYFVYNIFIKLFDLLIKHFK